MDPDLMKPFGSRRTYVGCRVLRTGNEFELGRILATREAVRFCIANQINVHTLLKRHASGDWGSPSEDDVGANQVGLEDGERILSTYKFPAGTIWVMTEAVSDYGRRPATIFLLPADWRWPPSRWKRKVLMDITYACRKTAQ